MTQATASPARISAKQIIHAQTETDQWHDMLSRLDASDSRFDDALAAYTNSIQVEQKLKRQRAVSQ